MSSQREKILEGFRQMTAEGTPIIGVGAGCGLSAVCAEAYGADLIILYNSGRFRMAGYGATAGRMPFSNANKVVMEMADEIFPVVKHTPLIAGIFASDPYIELDRMLDKVIERGFAGVQNFPTVGSIGGTMAKNLEGSGLGYGQEVRMVRMARERDLLTTPYCFSVEEAERMADAGADLIVTHMDLTSDGLAGAATAPTLDECVDRIGAMVSVIKRINPESMIICHGGPISTPEDAQYIFDHVPDISGFYGASSAERIPVEEAIIDTTRSFKSIRTEGGVCNG